MPALTVRFSHPFAGKNPMALSLGKIQSFQATFLSPYGNLAMVMMVINSD